MPVHHTPTVYECDVCQCRAEGLRGVYPPKGWYANQGVARCPVHRQDIDAYHDALNAWSDRHREEHDSLMAANGVHMAYWQKANPPPVAPWEVTSE